MSFTLTHLLRRLWAQRYSLQEPDLQLDLTGDYSGSNDQFSDGDDSVILVASSRLAHDVCCY